MTNQPRLRSIVRVQICSRKAQCCIPRISCACILGTQRQNLRFSRGTRAFRRRIRIADISQLITYFVCDDIRVQSFLLSLVDKRVLCLKGELCVGAAVQARLEFHRWRAESEVETGDGRRDKARRYSSRSIGSRGNGS
jgi:hypothetical protein